MTGRRFNQIKLHFLNLFLKYFYIDGIKFNYNLEFDTSNPKNLWKLNVPLIEYFETLNITIPHYCYHKNLSIAGNCRMCLIELKKSPKPIVSCAMIAKSSLAANTEIYTNSPLVKKARENIMEFLLLNHPLDCPICDQGGECDLQDQSLFFGVTKKRFYNFRRVVVNKNIGPIVKTVMTRCIHCTRCVRFAAEIAGVEDLGVFGRGVQSEIGTYIGKVFQSELSGNVIDICPVGALTSKPYPFIGRSWELKSVTSIDLSDGFGLDTQIFLKNNKIIKILPGYNQKDKTNNWITNKTRFLFDGMFTLNRKLTKTVTSGKNNKINVSTWSEIFKDIIYTVYFYDHLNRHFFKVNPITLVFDENASLETLTLLQLIQSKFPNFQIRKNSAIKINNDFEALLQTSSGTNDKDLNNADACLLIGTNPRYEGSYLNLKLKKRISKGNFKVFTFNNINNLTFPAVFLGNNIKTLKTIIEGNHSICQIFKESKNLVIIVNSDVFERHDTYSIASLIQFLKKNTELKTNVWNGYNLLNNRLNSTGSLLLNSFKDFTYKDMYTSSIIYFINTEFEKAKEDQFLDLKLLNYLHSPELNITVIEQNNKSTNINQSKLKTHIKLYKQYFLPNNVFFETSGSFITTEGILKKSIKIVSSKKNTKDDWQLLRKLYATLNNITFVSNYRSNNKIEFNCKNSITFCNFMNFLYFNTLNLNKLSGYLVNQKNQGFYLESKNFNAKKFYVNNTLFKKNLNDFFIDGLDSYSKQSITMTDCSNSLRSEKTNFEF